MITPVFIDAADLGAVLETKVRVMLSTTDKRQRSREMKKIVRILRDLSLLPWPELTENTPPTMLSYGVRYDGKLGVIVTWEPTTRIQGDIAP